MNGNRSIKMRMEWVFQEWFVKDDNEDDMKRGWVTTSMMMMNLKIT